jgi:hypothetical protein
VLDHGGGLWVDDIASGGAHFSVRLPGAHVAEPLALVVEHARHTTENGGPYAPPFL